MIGEAQKVVAVLLVPEADRFEVIVAVTPQGMRVQVAPIPAQLSAGSQARGRRPGDGPPSRTLATARRRPGSRPRQELIAETSTCPPFSDYSVAPDPFSSV